MDVNTPEVLCTYFNILAAKNPPVDLLVKYLNHICANKLRKPQAMVELEFPVTIGKDVILQKFYNNNYYFFNLSFFVILYLFLFV